MQKLLKTRQIYFSTLTIDKWIPVLGDYPDFIKIIYESFQYLVDVKKMEIFSFVIMKDHFHVIWEITNGEDINDVVSNVKKHLGNKMVQFLSKVEPRYLDNFQSERSDRKYKIWKLKSKSIRLLHFDIVLQKILYIHKNPTKGEYFLVEKPEDYTYSSAKSYKTRDVEFQFLKLFYLK